MPPLPMPHAHAHFLVRAWERDEERETRNKWLRGVCSDGVKPLCRPSAMVGSSFD